MTTTALVPDAPPPENLHLVALAPSDIPATQQAITNWCEEKIASLAVERSDFLDHARIAEKNEWQSKGLRAAAQRTQRTIEYYEKVKAAVAEGYLIVPNFPVEVLAVRVSRRRPEHEVENQPGYLSNVKPDLSGVGEGRNVSPRPTYQAVPYTRPDPQDPKKTEERYRYVTDEYGDVAGFPMLAVKPVVVAATARAMALKVFDDIGVVTGRKQDPVVVGRIYDPRDRWRQKFATFFIAWWFETRAL